MVHNVTFGRNDLRWLDANGNVSSERGEQGYAFRSTVTDEAQKILQESGFSGTYIRHLSTGHCETQEIALAMLTFAERNDGIVGLSLEGLVRDTIAQSIMGYTAGRILYEVLKEPWSFKVSADTGIVIPDFTGYGGIDTYIGGRLVPERKDRGVNKQVEQVIRNIYIELQPKFVGKLGSAELNHGPHYMPELREKVARVR
ncbi:MAG TPA: hypothetical protein HA362_06605 [Nanoarchaeota archaeon]|nr:hypothetical protein [Nanoarchaeota archaeon]